ncbi:S-adenosyl-L-methionine-dependent methyltransferase [Xylona heveae TC161]|uniref:S-adenosyl-L-methionine-dependent methyltransferase n=1 Tax=Xylona heveae (strain CBS 132557 / TC161) TaxID=1328760 RepID=A0A165FLY3_XYLHT|nr:S-adenosyl-L-methionine-dependent methyltransferase [Xylona heveae TC161]KZF21135.1 S-adenosyl-L-methionine-dependent methyltransferase [Xylona heveae TC161]
MANTGQASNYKQGYSSQTVATQQIRTVESEAAFLLPYIKRTDCILDVGCGPGTITTGFVKYASEGRTIGIDISANVLGRANAVADDAGIPREGPGCIIFEEGNVLEGLAFSDNTFDIVFCAHTFGYMPPPDMPLKALKEMRRVLKPGGILATRDTVEQHFYPRSVDLDRLWVGNFRRAVLKGDTKADLSPPVMPALFRRAGFDTDGGKVRIGTGSTVFSGADTRRWLSKRAESQLQPGDPLYRSWLEAGITEDEIHETLLASRKWAETEDAWYAALQCEMLAWK